jgi:hypothetical protein
MLVCLTKSGISKKKNVRALKNPATKNKVCLVKRYQNVKIPPRICLVLMCGNCEGPTPAHTHTHCRNVSMAPIAGVRTAIGECSRRSIGTRCKSL